LLPFLAQRSLLALVERNAKTGDEQPFTQPVSAILNRTLLSDDQQVRGLLTGRRIVWVGQSE